MYKLIWLDYFDHSKSERTGCFIYRFLKKNKTLRCQKLSADMQALTDYSKQKRYDKYTLLKGSRFAYKNNVSDREHYIGILSDITGNDISSLTEKSDDELESISEAYEEKLLFGCITDFFQNSGYRFRKKAPDGIAINDEYVEKCWKLYDGLLDEEQDDVFIPLCFDVRSGAGIYILSAVKGLLVRTSNLMIYPAVFSYQAFSMLTAAIMTMKRCFWQCSSPVLKVYTRLSICSEKTELLSSGIIPTRTTGSRRMPINASIFSLTGPLLSERKN